MNGKAARALRKKARELSFENPLEPEKIPTVNKWFTWVDSEKRERRVLLQMHQRKWADGSQKQIYKALKRSY